MSVRKRIRKYKDGQVRETWLVDYVDGGGVRHTESFARKKEADARHAEVRVNVGKGIHTPTSLSKTVAQAADDWLSYVEGEGRERATLAQYRGHVVHHIVPRIGNERLATLTKPRIELLRDQLVHDLKTRATAKKVLTTLKSILKDAARRGNVAQNVATDTTITISKRDDEKLEIGKDIPDPAEIKAILGAGQGRWRPFLIAAIFTGMRVSELRGLRWQDVDFDAKVVRVRQRADRYGKIGPPKSQSSRRDIPIGPFVVNTLKEWRLACPHELVFPNGVGNVENLSNTSGADGGRRRWRLASSMPVSPSTRASTHCGTSTLRGPSTGKRPEVRDCR